MNEGGARAVYAVVDFFFFFFLPSLFMMDIHSDYMSA